MTSAVQLIALLVSGLCKFYFLYVRKKGFCARGDKFSVMLSLSLSSGDYLCCRGGRRLYVLSNCLAQGPLRWRKLRSSESIQLFCVTRSQECLEHEQWESQATSIT